MEKISPDCRLRHDCRLCGGRISKVLDLGATPPANEFASSGMVEAEVDQDTFPLFLSACHSCGHVQLPVVVDPRRLFYHYVYVSGTSSVFVDHFRRYAETMIERLGLVPGDLVVDIGSNDGTLLSFFKAAGMRVLGVDPASAIAAAATERGIPTVPDFLTVALARDLRREHGPAKLVTANNVFAHADDLKEVADACRVLLDVSGTFSFEVSYLPSVVRGTLFDTVYHEHTSYHHLGPLVGFLERSGLGLYDAELVDTHGGSVRVLSSPAPFKATDRCRSILAEEQSAGYVPDVLVAGGHGSSPGPIEVLGQNVENLGQRLKRLLCDVRLAGKTVAGFGAPAKVTTLMHRFGLGRDDISFIVDDSPLKQGLFTPGKYVPVLPSSALYERRPDYCVVLAWNFAEPIIRSHKKYLDEGGSFIVPIPELKVYPQ